MNQYWKKYYRDLADDAGNDPYCRVGRTLNKRPMSDAMFQRMAARVLEKLKLQADNVALDFCCGNGLFSSQMALRCRRVVAVDFSEDLIEEVKSRSAPNITGIVGDALNIEFDAESFDRILFAAALQHFSQAQIIRLFIDLQRWLKPDGILMVTDILDASRIWNFFDSPEREDLYFQNTLSNIPLPGTWLDRPWLEKLARHAGFSKAQILKQSDDYWYAHYRFDLLCRK